MITYWLVVSISIAGGDWMIFENTKMSSHQECLTAAKERLEKSEKLTVMDEHKAIVKEEREIVVACSIHWPAEL